MHSNVANTPLLKPTLQALSERFLFCPSLCWNRILILGRGKPCSQPLQTCLFNSFSSLFTGFSSIGLGKRMQKHPVAGSLRFRSAKPQKQYAADSVLLFACRLQDADIPWYTHTWAEEQGSHKAGHQKSRNFETLSDLVGAVLSVDTIEKLKNSDLVSS